MTAPPRQGAPLVTIVMYHFVRPSSPARFPRFAALDPAAFREQLRYIRRHYSMIRLADIAAAAAGALTLPPQPAVLTFDDGYRDHYASVFPLLVEHEVPAIFFPARSALVDRRVLDANKVQFVLAAAPDSDAIVATIDRAIAASGGEAGTVAEHRARWWHASRFDGPSISYVKRMLQHGLPEQVRRTLVDTLFQRYVTDDEAGFAEELYLTVGEAREMRAAGMDFGGHGDRHVPLPVLAPVAQAREIDGSLEALDAIGVPRGPFAYCFVKGEHDAHSVALLRERGCTTAVTTREDLVHPHSDDLLTLPRIDTNRLPCDGDAAPNDWTRKACG